MLSKKEVTFLNSILLVVVDNLFFLLVVLKFLNCFLNLQLKNVGNFSVQQKTNGSLFFVFQRHDSRATVRSDPDNREDSV